jgi:hypothetical protein
MIEAGVIRTRPAPCCLLCGREGRIVYQDVRDRSLLVPGSWSFRVCKDCDFAWLDPHPIPGDVALAYVGEYYTHNQNRNPISLGRNPLMRALRGPVLSARRQREQIDAVRRTGDVNAEVPLRAAERLGVRWFSLLEKMGNSFFEWGGEIELIAERSGD